MTTTTDDILEVVASTGAAVQRDGMRPGAGYGPWTERLDVAGADLGRMNNGAPLLVDHQARSDLQIGVVEGARVENGKIIARVRFSKSPMAQAMRRDVIDRVRRNVSCGYSVSEWRDDTRKGDAIPTYTATRFEIIELSLVPAGADPAAQFRSATPEPLRFRSMTVTAQAAPEAAPVTTHTPPDALVIERERTAGILLAARGFGADMALAGDLIAEGTPLDQARTRLQNAAWAAQQATRVNSVYIEGGTDHTDPAGIAEDAATALAHRLYSGVELKGRAREYRGLRASQLVGELMAARGVHMPRFASEREIVRRAGMMTTSDLPYVLASSLNKALLPQFEQARSGLKMVARPDTVRDFKTFSRHRVGEFPALAQVREHGEYTYGAIGEARETATLEKFGRIMSLSYEMIVGDDLQALATATTSAALAAATLEADKLAAAVTSNPTMADGVAVFHSTHGNVGTPGTISTSSVGEATGLMRRQKGIDGVTILNIQPRYIVCAAMIETAAHQLVATLAPHQTADDNTQFRNLQVVVEPRLDAHDTNGWYVFGDPSISPSLSIAYLEGEEAPMVETRNGFNIDGVEVKVRWSLKAYWADWRSAVSNAGA